MSSDIMKRLSTTFDLAIRRHEAKALTQPQDWAKLAEIEKRHNTARAEEEHRYVVDHDKRMDQARADIYSKRGKPTHNMPAPSGSYGLSHADFVDAQARILVDLDRVETLESIDRSETIEIGELVDDALKRRAISEKTRTAFNEAVNPQTEPNGQSVPDRKSPQHSHS